MVTGCIQFSCCKDVSQGVVISINIKGQPIQIFVEFFDYCPFEVKTFQLVCGVMEFGLGQAPPDTGYYSICVILMGLVENSSQARPTDISMEPERLGEICKGKIGHCGTQTLQVIKGLLVPVVSLNGSLLLASVFTLS